MVLHPSFPKGPLFIFKIVSVKTNATGRPFSNCCTIKLLGLLSSEIFSWWNAWQNPFPARCRLFAVHAFSKEAQARERKENKRDHQAFCALFSHPGLRPTFPTSQQLTLSCFMAKIYGIWIFRATIRSIWLSFSRWLGQSTISSIVGFRKTLTVGRCGSWFGPFAELA